MKHLREKQDYYEARPYLFMAVGWFGLISPLLLQPSTSFFRFSYVCSLVLALCTHKILSMRKEYRRRQ